MKRYQSIYYNLSATNFLKGKKIQMLNNGIYTVWKLVSCGRTMSMGNDLLSEKRGLAFSTIFLVFKCKMLLQFCFI